MTVPCPDSRARWLGAQGSSQARLRLLKAKAELSLGEKDMEEAPYPTEGFGTASQAGTRSGF